ncbi:MAG: hypothetical protein IID32_03820 [Planctomycetes bacterium]|nr:hypothetical protein [Planctomycetota bacterium]
METKQRNILAVILLVSIILLIGTIAFFGYNSGSTGAAITGFVVGDGADESGGAEFYQAGEPP